MNFLIVGFGSIGLRHYEALRSFCPEADIEVVDLNAHCISLIDDENLSFIGTSCKKFSHYSVIVVSSSANCRFQILESLLSSSVTSDLLILEKVLLQEPSLFTSFLSMAVTISSHCYVNQWFRNFLLKNNILNLHDIIINASIYGCNWGVLCNSLHFLDAFDFFSQGSLPFVVNKLDKPYVISTKRDGFFDVLGSFELSKPSQDILLKSFSTPSNVSTLYLDLSLSSGDSLSFSITRQFISLYRSNNIVQYEPYKISHEMVYFYQNFFSGSSICLPSINDSISQHLTLFSIVDSIPSFPRTNSGYSFT